MMKYQTKKLLFSLAIVIATPMAYAQLGFMQSTHMHSIPTLPKAPVVQSWMNSEVGDAWAAGYKGQGTTITFVDDFKSNSVYSGNVNGTVKLLQHGMWTSDMAKLVAPSAAINTQDLSNLNAVQLARGGLNTINLSYAIYANSGYTANQINWSAREQSIINYANNGSAVISKAAGNDYGVAVGSTNSSGKIDYLNSALMNSKSAIFVGALDKNGTTASKANIASYSNVAGADTAVQNKFLVVGVTGGNDSNNKLYGTSFAAPIISGYSAILGSKFTTADATKISNQLLSTARTDTIANYNASTYGKGEASIARALAPVSIR
ncbi:S8 family serine peptidase [Polynucleobacter sp. JS-Safj-400b-B2]|uniref:S8 family serine peptidase n=1 Tax=Polynucleobacter sp. JS-Safj-400b-B2 TaxID=2576921 RepID=UPI001C0DA3DC|nr:S8 family serine peptidase [Polynucleobacter sp. JS-Safj-400b-B2]